VWLRDRLPLFAGQHSHREVLLFAAWIRRASGGDAGGADSSALLLCASEEGSSAKGNRGGPSLLPDRIACELWHCV
jgi:hypothetical protein